MKEARAPELMAAERARLLRQRAEERLRTTRGDIQRMSPEDVQQLVYALQVSQIELQLQNEELQRAQQELTAARDRYSDLYDFAPVGYVTLSPEGVIREANLTATTLLGTERAHLVDTLLSRFISANARDTFRQHLHRLRTARGCCTCEVSVQRSGGLPMILKLESIAVEEAHGTPRQFRTILSDVSARVAAEEALRTLNETLEQRVVERTRTLQESEERYRDLFENASDMIATMTPDGVLTSVNRSVQQHLGYSPAEVLGKNWRELTTPGSSALTHKYLARALGEVSAPHIYEFEALDKKGRAVPIEGRVRCIRDAAGAPTALHGIYRDITHRREVDRLKDELIATVSHELRTPLTSLRGYSELLLTRDFPPQQQRDMVSIIHQESTRLSTLINDFLDLQCIAAGQQSYTFAPVALEPLLREAMAVFSSDQERYPFRFAVHAPLPLVHADPNRIRQVLRNLLSNAIKYSPDGGTIEVGARRAGAEVLVWITDHGIGIPPEALPKLFAKFFRADNATTRQIGGTGLGLAIVKEIINAHQGRVWVDITVGKGSTFFVAIPVAPS